MGHYDSCYEDFHTQQRNKRAAEAHALYDEAYQLRLDLKRFDVPERFVHSLEDLMNYFNASWPKTK
jgi:hypothetical protein